MSTRILVYSAQLEAIGGIESHVIEFCLRMTRAGNHVTLLCSRSRMDAKTCARLGNAGVSLLLNESPWFMASASRKWLWTLLALTRLTPRRFDAVYTNGQGLNPVTVQSWFRWRTRVVHHHHTACDEKDIALWPPSYKRAMQRADALVVCADFIRARMRTAISRDDVQVVYCFSRDVLPALQTREPDAPVSFGYFGRLIDGKGVNWILRLSRDQRLAGITWKLWGGEGAYKASDFAPYERVSYMGGFSDEAGLRSALAAIDCFVLFSTTPEGLPISLMEVMAAGKPWIATAQGGIPELVHDPDSCVLVGLDDYETLVQTCLAMKTRILEGQLDRARQKAFHADRFGDRALLARWTAVLRNPEAAR